MPGSRPAGTCFLFEATAGGRLVDVSGTGACRRACCGVRSSSIGFERRVFGKRMLSRWTRVKLLRPAGMGGEGAKRVHINVRHSPSVGCLRVAKSAFWCREGVLTATRTKTMSVANVTRFVYLCTISRYVCKGASNTGRRAQKPEWGRYSFPCATTGLFAFMSVTLYDVLLGGEIEGEEGTVGCCRDS